MMHGTVRPARLPMAETGREMLVFRLDYFKAGSTPGLC
jgi:hypothetical protein